MKVSKIYLLSVLMAFTLISCVTAPSYVPEVEDIVINKHGSFITVFSGNWGENEGELIAVDSTSVIILEEQEFEYSNPTFPPKKLSIIDIRFIEGFNIRYAQSKNYGWTIPVFTLGTLLHGFWAFFSLPINLITTITVTVGGINAYTYDEDEITIPELRAFARFPQGIPPNIKLSDIK